MIARGNSKILGNNEEVRMSILDEIQAAERFDQARPKSVPADFDRCKVVRRFWFNVNREGEIGSSLETSIDGAREDVIRLKDMKIDCTDEMKDKKNQKRAQSAVPESGNLSPVSGSLLRKSLQVRLVPPRPTSSTSATTSSGAAEGGLRYYSVLMTDDDVPGVACDFSRDYRRYAYRDFSLAHLRIEGNIDPDDMLKWLISAKPRNQDDVLPIMQLCKGVLKDIMEKKISCRQKFEGSLRQEISVLRNQVKEKEACEQQLLSQILHLEEHVEQQKKMSDDLQIEISDLKEKLIRNSRNARSDEKDSQISELSAKINELVAKNEEAEKKLQSTNMIVDLRTKEFFRAHNSLLARMQMTPRDIVCSWNLDDQTDGLRCLIQEHHKCVERLQPSDFQSYSSSARQTLARKLIEAMKVASTSWMKTISDLFDCQPVEFLDKVMSWYKQENIVTDGVKYQQEVEKFKHVIEGTDLKPLYDIFRQGIAIGKYSVAELVFSCSGMNKDETAMSISGMTLGEIEQFTDNRDAILKFVQTRKSTEAREKEEAMQKKSLGFLHISSGKDNQVDPMEICQMLSFVAKACGRKIMTDVQSNDGKEKRLNIMKVTRILMHEMFNSVSDVRMQIAKLVKGIEVNSANFPRLGTFKILSGMESSKPWCERPCAFLMEFIIGVVEGIWADQEVLAEFAKQNYLPRPDSIEQPDLDRIEWVLTDHDIKIPIVLLLKSAMHACELHPCGYGYQRDQMQKVVAKACNPPPEYVTYNEERILESKKRFKLQRIKANQAAEELRVQAVMDRLSKSERKRPPQIDSSEQLDSIDSRTPKSLSSRRTPMKWQGDHEDSKSPKSAISPQEFGVAFEQEGKAWFDVFCHELLLLWFEQQAIIEAQMTRAFDDFDKDGNGSLSLQEFKDMIDKSALKEKYSEKQILRMYSELTAQEGLLTKRDWLSVFHHVEFDVLTVIRPRRDSIRRLLTEDHWRTSPHQHQNTKVEKLRLITESTIDRVCDEMDECTSPLASPHRSTLSGQFSFASRARSKSPVVPRPDVFPRTESLPGMSHQGSEGGYGSDDELILLG